MFSENSFGGKLLGVMVLRGVLFSALSMASRGSKWEVFLVKWLFLSRLMAGTMCGVMEVTEAQ